MREDTRESALDKGGASPTDEGPTPVVPSVKKWRPADRGGELFQLRQDMLEGAIRERVSRYKETGDPIGETEAVELAKSIKDLRRDPSFDGCAAYLDYLAGQCLTLREGSAIPDKYITASAQLKVPPTSIASFNLAIPAGLSRAFGSESFDWLCSRCESVARALGQQRFPSVSFTDHFGFVLDPVHHVRRDSQPERGEVPVVPAPVEATIAQYIERAESSADHWDALVKVAAMLRRNRQPFGDALSDWLIEAAGRQARRPKGTTMAKRPRDALHVYAIVEALAALERCGLRAETFDREPGPACVLVGRVFNNLSPTTARNHWKKRKWILDRTDQYAEMVGP